MKRLFACTLMLIATAPSLAADANGYTAQYECRAGGQYCNVDVAALGNRTCDQVVSTSTPWSSINWSNNTICLEAGDHTGKGTLTIPSSANGTAGSYKVLRYTGNNNDEPWNQSDANKVKILRLVVEGADYWLIHRLSFPGTTNVSSERIWVKSASSDIPTNLIFNRIYIEGSGFNSTLYYGFSLIDGSYVTLQNSVVGKFYGGTPGLEAVGVALENGDHIRAVNNEFYDWSGHPLQVGHNGGPTIPGMIIENNDIYWSPAGHTQGGSRVRGEDPFSVKADGTAAEPLQIIHNRLWGARVTDYAYCCNGQDGAAIGINVLPAAPGGYVSYYAGFAYILIKNNIIFDNQQGIAWYPLGAVHQSIIGNIFYKHDAYEPGTNSKALWINADSTEVYLNSFIDNKSISIDFTGPTSDVRCNVFLNGGSQVGSPPASSIADYNSFYDTKSFSLNGTNSTIGVAVTTRANSTAYSVGAVIRTGASSTCSVATDTSCSLYRVTVAGTSASSAPPYCTTLGCTTNDGAMTVQAIRGPYTFYRKQRTSPEPYTIPYARAYVNTTNPSASAPEAGACPSNYTARSGIGINDAN